MTNRLQPQVGYWYNHLDKGDLFQVVAVDEESGTIEIQDFDGGLDEVDIEEWQQMVIEPAAAPEDLSGALGDVEPDDPGFSDAQMDEIRESFGPRVTHWEEIVENDDGQDIFDLPLRTPHATGSRRRDH